MTRPSTAATAQASMVSSGYVSVSALEVYVERHGHDAPLVLVHGAMGTIESCFSRLLPVIADRFEVIAIELQGRGHTRDTDRPLTYEAHGGRHGSCARRAGDRAVRLRRVQHGWRRCPPTGIRSPRSR